MKILRLSFLLLIFYSCSSCSNISQNQELLYNHTTCKIKVSEEGNGKYIVSCNFVIDTYSLSSHEKINHTQTICPAIQIMKDTWGELKIETRDKNIKIETSVNVDSNLLLITHGIGIYTKVKVTPQNKTEVNVIGVMLYSNIKDNELRVQAIPIDIDCELDNEKCFYSSNAL